jgi:hypothetical protein
MSASPSRTEEIVQPYPTENRTATKFRSTWLASSLKSARARGYLGRYLEHLPRVYHDAVLHSVAGQWLPIEVALAHYGALDALNLSEIDLLAIGEEVNKNFNNVVLQTMLRLARGAGMTPWTAVRQAQKVWDRSWVGGGYGIFKLGPNELRGEVVGWPCARFRYTRIAIRGTFAGTLRLFCNQVWVHEMPEHCTETALGYHIRWV